jgi:hypothetical protein
LELIPTSHPGTIIGKYRRRAHADVDRAPVEAFTQLAFECHGIEYVGLRKSRAVTGHGRRADWHNGQSGLRPVSRGKVTCRAEAHAEIKKHCSKPIPQRSRWLADTQNRTNCGGDRTIALIGRSRDSRASAQSLVPASPWETPPPFMHHASCVNPLWGGGYLQGFSIAKTRAHCTPSRIKEALQQISKPNDTRCRLAVAPCLKKIL